MARFLVVLDVDSTLIENEVIELLADAAGSRAVVQEITSRAMNGEIDFAESLRERVATLAGLSVSIFTLVGSQIVVTAGVQTMISAVHQAGGAVGVVSGGFHELIDPIVSALGIDFVRANRLDVLDGQLTGRLTGPIIDGQAKAIAVREWAADSGIALRNVITVGDGANDLEMMAISGLSVAFDAKAPVRKMADVLMNTRDLSQLLSLLGLRG